MSGIYIHIPYCHQACHYCDFHFSTNLKTRDELVYCLSKEIKIQKDYLPSHRLKTIYFGGGTPSLLTKEEFEKIFESIKSHFEFGEYTEITIEANPEDLTIPKLDLLKSFEVNRLSIGIQSFENQILQYFNRSHNSEQAITSINNARSQDITNISIDLIYGIPNQPIENFRKDLHRVIELELPHISAYCLTIEQNTVFGKWYEQGKLQPANEEIAAQQFEILIEELESAGYVHYEISNFAKPGFKSKHNSAYWSQKPYLGIGPGAHSYDGQNRQFNIASNPAYIKKIKQNELPATFETLTQTQRITEYILTRIRTSAGIDLKELNEKYQYHLMTDKGMEIDKLRNQGLLILKEENLLLSKQGKLFADKITEDLIL